MSDVVVGVLVFRLEGINYKFVCKFVIGDVIYNVDDVEVIFVLCDCR